MSWPHLHPISRSPVHQALRKDGAVGLFNRLPFELISGTFEYSPYSWTPDTPRAYPRFPILLLQVCHRWRVIAIATLTLWTEIVILSSNVNCDLDLDAARLYVERSGSYPIFLTWYHHDWNQTPVIDDILDPAAARLKDITVRRSKFVALHLGGDLVPHS